MREQELLGFQQAEIAATPARRRASSPSPTRVDLVA